MPHHDMLFTSMLGSPQGGSGLSLSVLHGQIVHATCLYGFHYQFKDRLFPPNSVSVTIISTPSACHCHSRMLKLKWTVMWTWISVIWILVCFSTPGKMQIRTLLSRIHAERSAHWTPRTKIFRARTTQRGAGNTCIYRNVWCMGLLKFRSRSLKKPTCSAMSTRHRPLPKWSTVICTSQGCHDNQWLCNLPELHVFGGIQYSFLLQETLNF